MRFKVSLSLILVAMILFISVRYFTATSVPAQPNVQTGAVTVEALQQTEAKAEPAATAPATVISAINSLLLDEDELNGGEDPTLVMLYINGDNDLEEYIPDLVRKAQLGAVNENVITYMVLDWAGKDNSHLYKMDRRGATNCDFKADFTCGGRYLLGQNVFNAPEDMGDSVNLTKFISETMTAVPNAKNVVLTLVGHGGGWSPNLEAGQPKGHGGQTGIGGLLWDNYTGDGKPGNSLSTIDLRVALDNAYKATNRKIDLLYLDACLMGMWEVAHEVNEHVNYLLASESWSWTSFPYDQNLSDIGERDTAADIGSKWVANKAESLRSSTYPFTYSLLDLAKLPDLTLGLDGLASELISSLPIPGTNGKIRSAFAASDCFDSNADAIIKRSNPISTTDLDNYCDINSFVDQIKLKFTGDSEIANIVQSIQSALSSAVASQNFECGVPTGYSTQKWCWSQLGGISIYTPFGQDDWKRGAYGQLQVAKVTQWDELIDAYWNAPIPNEPQCPVEGCNLPTGLLAVEHRIYLPLVQR